MKRFTRLSSAAVLASALLGAGCADEGAGITVARPPPDAGCDVSDAPQRFEVYFVVDVSGSMEEFNYELSNTVESFARAFPERDAQDNRVLVDYYVIAFVNDVLWFPNNARRMTEPVAVQGALQAAIARGRDNTLLTRDLKNAEADENLLDALAEVINSHPREDAQVLVLVATDAGFREAPATLSGGIEVQSTFASVRADLESIGAQIHAFTPGALDGVTQQYAGQPALTTLPGSGAYSLRDLASSGELIEITLSDIAHNASCN